MYELLVRDKIPPKEIIDLACRFTTHCNHKGRNKKADFKASKEELLLIKLKAESWSMTEQELVRSCLLHVVSEVCSESKFSFDQCKRIPVEELTPSETPPADATAGLKVSTDGIKEQE